MKKLEMCGTTGPIYVFKSLVCYIHMLGAWSSVLRIHFSLCYCFSRMFRYQQSYWTSCPNVCFAESEGCGVGLVYMTEDEV
jgi:hypothetical protein